MFDTKIAIVLRDGMAAWQELNVAAFLTSGILGAHPRLLGDSYEDAMGNKYLPLIIQPIVVLSADAEAIKAIYLRALARKLQFPLYIEDMFGTGHDAANRASVRQYRPEDMKVAGIGIREAKAIVDKVTKGARIHA